MGPMDKPGSPTSPPASAGGNSSEERLTPATHDEYHAGFERPLRVAEPRLTWRNFLHREMWADDHVDPRKCVECIITFGCASWGLAAFTNDELRRRDRDLPHTYTWKHRFQRFAGWLVITRLHRQPLMLSILAALNLRVDVEEEIFLKIYDNKDPPNKEDEHFMRLIREFMEKAHPLDPFTYINPGPDHEAWVERQTDRRIQSEVWPWAFYALCSQLPPELSFRIMEVYTDPVVLSNSDRIIRVMNRVGTNPPDTLEKWKEFLWSSGLETAASVFQKRFGRIEHLRMMQKHQPHDYNHAVESGLGVPCIRAERLEALLRTSDETLPYTDQVLPALLGQSHLKLLHEEYSNGNATLNDVVVAILEAGVSQCKRIAKTLRLQEDHPLQRVERRCYAGAHVSDKGFLAWGEFDGYSRSMDILYTSSERFPGLPFEQMVCVLVHELVHLAGGPDTSGHGETFQNLSVMSFGSPPCPVTHDCGEPGVKKRLAAFMVAPSKEWTVNEMYDVVFLS